MDITNLFNMSLEVGQFISNSNSNLTGSLSMTLLIILGVLLLIAGLFKLPETLYIIPILPVLIIFSIADPMMKIVLGIVSLMLAYVLFSSSPWR